jgi:tryptophan-rich sensory protein
VCIAIPLAVGGVAAWLTKDAMATFSSIQQPPLSPPAWLFPIVWTVLYTLMGISSYLVYILGRESDEGKLALALYAAQLAVNFVWPILFFDFQWYLISLLWLLLLVVLVIAMIRSFYKIRPMAAYFNIPYVLWLLFATYLNFGIWRLN